MKPLEDFKTNSELVEAILELPNNKKSKTALGKLNREKLEMEYLTLQDELETNVEAVSEPVVDVNTVEEVKVEEEVKDIVEPAKTAVKADDKFKTEQPKSAADVFLKNKEKVVQVTIDLDIHRKHYYFAKNTEGKVLVENLGFGDVYYGSGEVEYGNTSTRIIKGQSVEMEADKAICLISSSSPRVKITEI